MLGKYIVEITCVSAASEVNHWQRENFLTFKLSITFVSFFRIFLSRPETHFLRSDPHHSSFLIFKASSEYSFICGVCRSRSHWQTVYNRHRPEGSSYARTHTENVKRGDDHVHPWSLFAKSSVSYGVSEDGQNEEESNPRVCPSFDYIKRSRRRT